MGDLAYYLAIEIHCTGKSAPDICKDNDRETHRINRAINNLDERCETRATKLTCDLFENIDNELKSKTKDAQKLRDWHAKLDIECKSAKNVEYCERKNFFQEQRWKSTFFFDPIYSGGQTDSSGLYTEEKISYGDVTGCVDYFLTPEKLLAGSETSLYKPIKRLKKYGENEIHLFPEQRGDLDLSVSNRCFDAIWNFEGNRAAHVNHTHFQSELILSQRKMHLLAISLRTFENNLFGALTANAISDHYLQDSMAPGHITAWRSRLTDVAANAHHDKKNRDGIDVDIDSKILATMNAVRIDGVDTTIVEKLLERSDEKANAFSGKSVREYFLTSGQKNRRDLCGKKNCLELSPDEQIAYMKKIGDILLTLKRTRIRGDDFLWDDDQGIQRMLILVMNVRSILDVLQSRKIDENAAGLTRVMSVDSFKNSSWFWVEVDEKDEKSGLTFVKPSNLKAHVGTVAYNVENSPKFYGYEKTDPIYGVSIGFDDMLFGEQQNRATLLFERLIIGNANEKRDAFNLALVAGVQASRSKAENSAGLSLRGALVLPQTETIISVPLRYIRMHEGERTRWRPTIGVRLDQGFTSFSTFYLQLTHDYARQKDGSIRSGLSIGAGLGFAAPECRIPGIKQLLACR
ncbi:hypothetical protein NHH73_18080 [Oxalobacteraceae bacterium OTU3CINTB1]|nr:hypothetical protein NHH73_18080 [Oxalobacteraceae bacterium OTU3CINTB1]